MADMLWDEHVADSNLLLDIVEFLTEKHGFSSDRVAWARQVKKVMKCKEVAV
jgi:hypothetical protein